MVSRMFRIFADMNYNELWVPIGDLRKANIGHLKGSHHACIPSVVQLYIGILYLVLQYILNVLPCVPQIANQGIDNGGDRCTDKLAACCMSLHSQATFSSVKYSYHFCHASPHDFGLAASLPAFMLGLLRAARRSP